MSKNYNLKYLFFIFIVIVLLFQDFLQTYFPIIKFFDEFIVILTIPIFFIKFLNNRRKHNIIRYNIFIVLLYLVLVLVGMYSSIKYRYQPLNIAFSDLLLVSKFFLSYMLSEMIFDIDLIKNNKRKLEKTLKIIIITFFILTILNLLFKLWPQHDYRFGIMSNQLFYGHPTILAASCIFLLALIFVIKINNMKKYVCLLLFILLSTLRFKAIGAAILILLIIIYINKTNKRISISKLGIVAVIIALLAWEQISFYYIDLDGSARKVLNETSFKIAKDYFPIGTGFGTYASHFSAVNYSPVYSMYRINNTYGLQYGNTFFVSDVFWPMIIGQFGIIGIACYIGILYFIYKKIQENYNSETKNVYIAKIICLAYLVISSTSESAFVHFIAIPLALIIGINTSKNKNIKNERK